jgi:hypothetical protein
MYRRFSTKYDLVHEVAREVKALGFMVYMTEDTDEWVLFSNGNGEGVATCAVSDLIASLKISSVHKPSRIVGTGYRLEEMQVIDFLAMSDDEKTNLLGKALVTRTPQWDRKNDSLVKKWATIYQYIKDEQILKYRPYDEIMEEVSNDE